MIRILTIEDDPPREADLRSWLPAGVIYAVVATSAGKAVGIVSRDRGKVYAGIVLDLICSCGVRRLRQAARAAHHQPRAICVN